MIRNPETQAPTKPYFKNLSRKDYIVKAWEIIAKEGYEAVSIRRLSKELGCSTTTMYRHFKNLDELLFFTHLSSLNTYIANIIIAAPSWKTAWDMHFGIWELYSDQAFRNPEAFDLIFYQNYDKDVDASLKEYYEMFPEDLLNVPPVIKRMLQIPGFYERDYSMLQNLIDLGELSEATAKKINHIECNLYLGYFKYIKDTHIPEEDIPATVTKFIGEVKEIISMYLERERKERIN